MQHLEDPHKAFLKGDLEPFYRTLYPGLLVYASRILGEGLGHLAADCVQDAVMETYTVRHRLPDARAWYAYLLRSLYHSGIDMVRKYRSRANYLNSGIGNEELPDVETAILEQETLETLRQVIARLPERMQSILRMNYVEGLKNAEIAERLGVSEITVKKEKARMLSMLRDMLGPELYLILMHSGFLSAYFTHIGVCR